MNFCTHCGALLPDGAAICPLCGTAVAQAPTPPPGDAYPPPSGQSFYPAAPSQPETPLSTLQYLGCLVLFAIPLVGLVLMLVWSFGSGFNPARKRLARAYLIRTCIFTLIAGAVIGLLFAFGVALYSASPFDSYGYYSLPDDSYYSTPYYGGIPGFDPY